MIMELLKKINDYATLLFLPVLFGLLIFESVRYYFAGAQPNIFTVMLIVAISGVYSYKTYRKVRK